MLAIQLQTVALTIGRERTLGLLVGALVPIDTEPLEIVEKLVLEARLAAREIGVLNAQHHDATGLTGKEPVEECSAGVANMQLSRRRRSEANADRGSGAHPWMLARAEGRKPFGHGFTRILRRTQTPLFLALVFGPCRPRLRRRWRRNIVVGNRFPAVAAHFLEDFLHHPIVVSAVVHALGHLLERYVEHVEMVQLAITRIAGHFLPQLSLIHIY